MSQTPLPTSSIERGIITTQELYALAKGEYDGRPEVAKLLNDAFISLTSRLPKLASKLLAMLEKGKAPQFVMIETEKHVFLVRDTDTHVEIISPSVYICLRVYWPKRTLELEAIHGVFMTATELMEFLADYVQMNTLDFVFDAV